MTRYESRFNDSGYSFRSLWWRRRAAIDLGMSRESWPSGRPFGQAGDGPAGIVSDGTDHRRRRFHATVRQHI